MNGLRLISIAIVSLAMMTTGCGRSSKVVDKPVIAVTFPQQASLLRPLIGNDYEIVTLLPSGSDPETYEPSMSTMKALTRADIYFTMATPGFEEAVIRGVGANFPNIRVIDSSYGIERLEHFHGRDHHDQHGDDRRDHAHEDCPAADPHILTSVRNARKMAANMAADLSRLNPTETYLYSRRLAELDSTLSAVDDSIRSIYSTGSRPFVVKHPSFSYFARDYGLEQISLEQEGKEPSPKQYQKTLAHIHSGKPAVLIAEYQHASPRLNEAARAMGIPVMEVDLNSEDWVETLYKIARATSKTNATLEK